jgi:hypothetical protein
VGNRGSTALKVAFDLPKALRTCAEVVPASAVVEAGATFKAMLVLTPTPDLLRACGDAADADSGAVQLALAIRAAGQALPAPFLLRFQLSQPRVSVEPSALHFGRCALGESVCRVLMLTNRSTLKLDFGFGALPAELDVQPGDGLGSLLPYETVERVVVFTPRAHGPLSASLTLGTTQNKAVTLAVTGYGVEAALALSATTVRFAATPFGGRAAASIEVRSQLRYGAAFELRPPEGSPFAASPSVLWLQPGEQARVQLIFKPAEPARAHDAADAAETPAEAVERGGGGGGGGGAARAGGLLALPDGGASRPDSAASSLASRASVGGSALALAERAVEFFGLVAIYAQTHKAAAATADAEAGGGGAAGAEGAQALSQHASELTQHVRVEGVGLPAVVVFDLTGGVNADIDFGTASVGKGEGAQARGAPAGSLARSLAR